MSPKLKRDGEGALVQRRIPHPPVFSVRVAGKGLMLESAATKSRKVDERGTEIETVIPPPRVFCAKGSELLENAGDSLPRRTEEFARV
jgi:hypothetical protein